MIEIEFTVRAEFAIADLSAIVQVAGGTIQFNPRTHTEPFEITVHIHCPVSVCAEVSKWLDEHEDMVIH